ncbi:MAG TPA: hypothetical protein PKC30_07140 [Saprospiraceae bacterium]|nr:hypothetical protein [Saprospiraceae bacterium]
MNTHPISWAVFLSYFPTIELPVTLNEETLDVFSRENKVLPAAAISHFILQWEGNHDDGMTEYIPCFALPAAEEFTGLVYWKGGIAKYEFILVTIGKDGRLISRKSLASTQFNSKSIRKSVAMIDEDLIVHIMAGALSDDKDYEASSSRAFCMEILSSGDVLFTMDEAGYSEN